MPAEVEAACRDSLRCASIFGDLMHCRALIVLTLVLPAVLAGQSPPTPELPNAVMLQFIRFADIFGSRLVAAFDSIPAVRYDYRPTPSQQTIGYIAQRSEERRVGKECRYRRSGYQ